MIKTFRGLIATGGIDKVSLHTTDGSIGYRILKLQIMGVNLAATTQESTVKIYKIPQTTTTSDVDLSDQTLVAVAYRENYSGTNNSDPHETIVFDQDIFNQDLFITHTEASGSNAGCNYYLVLEQLDLNLNENTIATLRNIRNKIC